jgi:molecular chaperone HtpG
VDHLLVAELHEFDGKQLQSISRGEVDLSKIPDVEGQPESEQQTVSETDKLVTHLKEALKEQVKDVRVSTRLTTSPACLVVDEYDIDPSLLRLLKASGQNIPTMKPILEINPRHPILVKVSNESDEQKFTDWAYVLFDQSKLTLGEQLDDPVRFVNRLNALLAEM